MRRCQSRQRKQEQKRQRLRKSQRSNGSVILLLGPDYEPKTRLKKFKVSGKPHISFEDIMNGKIAAAPRWKGEIELYEKGIDVSGEGFSFYIKSRWASGEEIQLAYLDVTLERTELGKYNFTAGRHFAIQKDDDFWSKIERLQKVDKLSYVYHESKDEIKDKLKRTKEINKNGNKYLEN